MFFSLLSSAYENENEEVVLVILIVLYYVVVGFVDNAVWFGGHGLGQWLRI